MLGILLLLILPLCNAGGAPPKAITSPSVTTDFKENEDADDDDNSYDYDSPLPASPHTTYYSNGKSSDNNQPKLAAAPPTLKYVPATSYSARTLLETVLYVPLTVKRPTSSKNISQLTPYHFINVYDDDIRIRVQTRYTHRIPYSTEI